MAGLGAVDAAVAGGGVEREQDDDDEEEVEEREGGEEADGDGHLPHRARGRSGSGRVDREGGHPCASRLLLYTIPPRARALGTQRRSPPLS